ncbi:hypothetical protein Tco_0049086 [Tanacetum coccineum]
MAITSAIFEGENSESNVINTVKLGLSMWKPSLGSTESLNVYETIECEKEEMNRSFIARSGYKLEEGKPSLGSTELFWNTLTHDAIFRISVDIFVRAFTTSANVPSIYIQLFWNTLTHDAKTGVYSFQVNEHWLTLSADLLRKALNVTPADSAHPFE